jgi:RimJ/RimL family protein N-acetyltransferase
MANFIKWLAQAILQDYSFYHIYGHEYPGETSILEDLTLRFEPVGQKAVVCSEDEIIAQQAWYHGDYSLAYACMKGPRIVGLCFFWYGARYSTRNFWPLSEGEAKLVQIIVLPEMRGQGVASSLIKFATQDMYQQGFKHLYARVWWSNTPSLRAFERAEWKRVAAVIELCLAGRKESFRLKLTRILPEIRD